MHGGVRGRHARDAQYARVADSVARRDLRLRGEGEHADLAHVAVAVAHLEDDSYNNINNHSVGVSDFYDFVQRAVSNTRLVVSGKDRNVVLDDCIFIIMKSKIIYLTA